MDFRSSDLFLKLSLLVVVTLTARGEGSLTFAEGHHVAYSVSILPLLNLGLVLAS